MANEKRDGDERQQRLERMRRLLTPISRERAREIGDQYTKDMRESVEGTRKQQDNLEAGETND